MEDTRDSQCGKTFTEHSAVTRERTSKRSLNSSVCSEQDVMCQFLDLRSGGGAGCIMGDTYSVAWRTVDAQYWGVPQRRKRIYLVADLDAQRAGEILFKSESLSGYSAEGFKSWQGAARSAESGTGETAGFVLNDQGGQCMEVSENVTGTLRAQEHGHAPITLEKSGVQLMFENHSQDTRYTGPIDTAQTVSATYGMGGNNQPFVVEDKR